MKPIKPKNRLRMALEQAYPSAFGKALPTPPLMAQITIFDAEKGNRLGYCGRPFRLNDDRDVLVMRDSLVACEKIVRQNALRDDYDPEYKVILVVKPEEWPMKSHKDGEKWSGSVS